MLFHKRHPPIGSRPGTLVIDSKAEAPVIRVIDFTPSTVDEIDSARLDDLRSVTASESVSWIDVQGLGDEGVLRGIASVFSFHALLLEDIVNVPQRPKLEVYDDHLLVVGRIVRVSDDGHLIREQLSLCLGAHYVITFQQQYGDVFDPIRERVRAGVGPIRKSGAGYLAYALLDLTIDAYYPAVEALGERLEELEVTVLDDPQPQVLKAIYRTKRELLELRRSVWPQREVFNTLLRNDTPFISPNIQPYFRDVYDHCVQIIDVLETHREIASSLVDLYMSSVSNRMNDVMRVLTIMASIFIPITFIAGVYGMNFDAMPELHYRLGYPLALGAMVLVVVGMLGFFWWRGWLGNTIRSRIDT